jgi:hypothetical protein
VSGIATTSLIVFAPVKGDSAARLPRDLASLGTDQESPFSDVPGTHFARLVFLPALTGPDDLPLTEEGSFLMLCADFDSDLRDWASALCTHGRQLGSILSSWDGFPGLDDAAEVERYLERNRVPAGFTIAGYRRARVAEVREALHLRQELRALAARKQTEKLSPSELRAAWRQLVVR